MQKAVHDSWTLWVRDALRGQACPLAELSLRTRLQVVAAAVLVAALLEALAAWLTWVHPGLRAQYQQLNVLIAERLGYSAPQLPEFSFLRVSASSLFVQSVVALVVWGSVGVVVVRFVLQEPVAMGTIAASALIPLAPVAALSVVVALVQMVIGSARVTASLTAVLVPQSVEVWVYSLASRIDAGALLHGLLCARLAVPHRRWRVAIGAGVLMFVLRSILIAGVVLLSYRLTRL